MNRKLASTFLLLLLISSLNISLIDAKHSYMPEFKALEISNYQGNSKLKVETYGTYTPYVIEHNNGVEYNWELTSEPTTNKFQLKLTFTNAEYYYQPPLNEELDPRNYDLLNATHAIKDGVVDIYRPENIVGSYAVYSNRPSWHYENGAIVIDNGKFAHIYRPLVSDSKGNTVWGVLSIENGLLTVTVDQGWLDKVAYPVIIDPNFGYTVQGGTGDGQASDTALGTIFTTGNFPVNLSVTNCYWYSSGAGGTTARFGLWAGAASNGANQKTSAEQGYAGSAIWATKAFSTTILPNTAYVLGAGVGTGSVSFYYDTVPGAQSYEDTVHTYANPLPQFTWNTNLANRMYSFYIVTAASAGTDSITISGLDGSNLYAQYGYYNAIATVTESTSILNSTVVRFKDGATVRALLKGSDFIGTPTWSVAYGSGIVALNASACSESNGVVTFNFIADWDYTEGTNAYDFYYVDEVGVNSSWISGSTFELINTLVTTSFAANVTTVTQNTPILLSGLVRYAYTTSTYTPSNYYPPNAAFTAVKIYDDDSILKATDSAIVNGAFSVVFNSSSLVKTTSYRVWIDMAGAGYTDGFAPDGDLVYVTTVSFTDVGSLIDRAFDYFFGAAFGFMALITTYVNGFLAYLSGALTNMLALVVQVFRVVNGTITFAVDWFTRIISFLVLLFTIVTGIIDGTYTVTTGMGNVWTFFSVSTWIDFIPIALVIAWFDSMDSRAKTQPYTDVFFGDLSTIINLLSFFIQMLSLVIDTSINYTMMLIDAIPSV